jgi:DNA-binding NtrC family response regulator
LREDLYFRLAVVTVHLPPLRERGEDLVQLARHFVQQFASDQHVPVPELSEDFLVALRARSWPGNVRQLRNELQRVWALADGAAWQAQWLSAVEAEPTDRGAPTDLAQLEQWAIDRALQQAGGNKAEAARLLGIGRRTLYDKLASRRQH